MVDIKRIRYEAVGSGQFLIYGLRDLPNRPFEGGSYLAARAYDEVTAQVVVEALRAQALGLPPKVESKVEVVCRLPVVDMLEAPKAKKLKGKRKVKV